MLKKVTFATTMLLAVAGCTSPAERQRDIRARQATEFLERLPSIADPGKVAARDIAFARAAADNGQWTAFREFAAPDARLDAPGGFVTSSMMAGLADPAQSASWAPNIVWSSCDGTLAVSAGRYADKDGLVGVYMTAWRLRSGGEYRWFYSTGSLDDPQPAPRVPLDTPEGDDLIVVEALDAISGLSADCPRPEEGVPDVPARALDTASDFQTTRSQDGTLQFGWEHREDGSRHVNVEYLRGGVWERVFDLAHPAPEG